MTLSVENVAVIDRAHYNGDPFWDGDQTLYKVALDDGDQQASVNVVVARGDAFISPAQVRRYLERKYSSLDELRSLARSPCVGRQAQVVVPIEPGEV